MKTITVNIDVTGEVKIEATGFKGSACTKATEEIERALGTVGKRNKKPEYWLGQQQNQQAKQ